MEKAKPFIVKDPVTLLRDIDVLAVSQTIQLGGILLDKDQEGTIHEYAHIVTAGLRVPQFHPLMSFRVEEQLRAKKKSNANYEFRAIAAEVLVIEGLGAMADRAVFIKDLQNVAGLGHLQERVMSRLEGRRWRIAYEDAWRVVRRIRRHAKTWRQELLKREVGDAARSEGSQR